MSFHNTVSLRPVTDPEINRETEDLRRKMVDSNIVTPLLGGLRDRDVDVRRSTVSVISRLAQYGEGPTTITVHIFTRSR